MNDVAATSPNVSLIELLPADAIQEIDRWIAKYPTEQRQSAVIQTLMIAQEHNEGWLTDEWITAVANYLQMPKIAVYEVATFYSMYDLKPVGKHKIYVCTNISCKLCGCDRIVDHLKQKLGVKLGETTDDGRFTLREFECLGACIGAPMMQIDKTYYEQLTTEKVDDILQSFQENE
ncbi:MAG: NADH-quinone oxidoreductase subunit NuoE [Legionellales bacterium]|nr:NADH-quinone oxidoreductase subunit NuoE [Legionellales bacterium]